MEYAKITPAEVDEFIEPCLMEAVKIEKEDPVSAPIFEVLKPRGRDSTYSVAIYRTWPMRRRKMRHGGPQEIVEST